MSEQMNPEERSRAGVTVSWKMLWGNVALVAAKLAAGIVGKSTAMVADAMHSASDVLATFGVIISLKVSKRPADSDHPYGHGKAESGAAWILGGILIVAGVWIGISAIRSITSGNRGEPGIIALYAAVLSIVVKEAMYQVTAATARRIRSSAVMADAWHHRSDAFSSVGTFIGILGARLGFPVLDPLAGLVVAVFIVVMGVKIIAESTHELMDGQIDTETMTQIQDAIRSVPGVSDVHSVAARRYGGFMRVDLRLGVDPGLTVVEGHRISVDVERAIESKCSFVESVLVHVDPESVHVDDPTGHSFPNHPVEA